MSFGFANADTQKSLDLAASCKNITRLVVNPAMRTMGVIRGSGLSQIERVKMDTPFGAPSDDYVVGRLGDAKLVFLPRHGRGHRIAPHEINYRANIFGMKQLGVEWIMSVSAVGSMREEILPGDMV